MIAQIAEWRVEIVDTVYATVGQEIEVETQNFELAANQPTTVIVGLGRRNPELRWDMAAANPCAIAQLAEALIRPVLAAGAAQLQYYHSDFAVHTKTDQSPVTEADRVSEVILLEALARIAPGIPVVAEESVSEGRIPAIGDTFFLVDPLDGTKEFINRRGEFTVNVALIELGVPTFGVVYAPALGDLYITLDAGHAGRCRVTPDATPASLADCDITPIRCRVPPGDGLVAVASRLHMTPETEQFLARFPIAERRDSGSSLKFCAIARGDADLYPRLAPTMEWDIAAGHAVLSAAGGAVTDPDGLPMRYGKSAAGFRNVSFVAWGTPEPMLPGA